LRNKKKESGVFFIDKDIIRPKLSKTSLLVNSNQLIEDVCESLNGSHLNIDLNQCLSDSEKSSKTYAYYNKTNQYGIDDKKLEENNDLIRYYEIEIKQIKEIKG
jgi:hypothetical protein